MDSSLWPIKPHFKTYVGNSRHINRIIHYLSPKGSRDDVQWYVGSNIHIRGRVYCLHTPVITARYQNISCSPTREAFNHNINWRGKNSCPMDFISSWGFMYNPRHPYICINSYMWLFRMYMFEYQQLSHKQVYRCPHAKLSQLGRGVLKG